MISLLFWDIRQHRLIVSYWTAGTLQMGPIRCHGPGSVVGIATGCRLDGPGIKYRWGRDFQQLSVPALGLISLLYNGYRVFPGGKERPGHDADPSPPSSAVGHERVELHLYSPYGPYGPYRACTRVHFTLPIHCPETSVNDYRSMLHNIPEWRYVVRNRSRRW